MDDGNHGAERRKVQGGDLKGFHCSFVGDKMMTLYIIISIISERFIRIKLHFSPLLSFLYVLREIADDQFKKKRKKNTLHIYCDIYINQQVGMKGHWIILSLFSV